MLTTLPAEALGAVIDAIGAPVFVVEVTEEGGFRFAALNHRLEALAGVSDAGLRGRTPAEALPADLAGRLTARLQQCLTEARRLDYEGFIDTENGRRRLRVTLTPLVGGDGVIRRIMGTPLDITESFTLASQLEQERALFGELAELSGDWFWKTDETGRFVPFDLVLERDGVRHVGVLAMTRRDLLDTALPPEDMAAIDAAMAQRKPFRDLVYPQVLPDGTRRIVRISGNPRFSLDGRFLGFVGTSSDITARHNWIKMQYARHKREALGRMAGGLAHELNNLLLPVVSLSRRARKRLAALPQPPEAILAMLDDITAAGRAARDVVGGVLTYSGGGMADQGPVVLSEVVARAVDTAAGLLTRSVRVERSIEPLQDLAAVTASDVSQVVINLMSNAADACGPGGTIWVSLGTEPASQRADGAVPRAILRVRDNGPGLQTGVDERVFDPFFTTKPVGEGSGLGLSVVYGIARNWGGDVSVASTPGEGAVFEIRLPLLETADADHETTQTPQTRTILS
ncbi:ATP-binding protein [Caenispirillum salinarum]|uniref:PAS domain-containing sensor histidine kinase n=1 Tax=Caenispirillum salinarum TaxID=859058 RepID=UPI00384C5A89